MKRPFLLAFISIIITSIWGDILTKFHLVYATGFFSSTDAEIITSVLIGALYSKTYEEFIPANFKMKLIVYYVIFQAIRLGAFFTFMPVGKNVSFLLILLIIFIQLCLTMLVISAGYTFGSIAVMGYLRKLKKHNVTAIEEVPELIEQD